MYVCIYCRFGACRPNPFLRSLLQGFEVSGLSFQAPKFWGLGFRVSVQEWGQGLGIGAIQVAQGFGVQGSEFRCSGKFRVECLGIVKASAMPWSLMFQVDDEFWVVHGLSYRIGQHFEVGECFEILGVCARFGPRTNSPERGHEALSCDEWYHHFGTSSPSLGTLPKGGQMLRCGKGSLWLDGQFCNPA